VVTARADEVGADAAKSTDRLEISHRSRRDAAGFCLLFIDRRAILL
jgi:hypothetical protein